MAAPKAFTRLPSKSITKTTTVVSSSSLPPGAATLAAQNTGNARLLDIKNILDLIYPGFVTKHTYNEIIAAANVEQSRVFPATIKGYMIRSRGSGVIKLSHVSGESGTKFLTIPKGSTFTDDKSYQSLTIYFQSPTVSEVVEIIAWE